ncbi:ABC transporter ATP-binding protein [Parasphaerochaeta coccoides]|uniref:Polyamine-transporting ATPase n=1 Tax=Parasphaerochaeta coccoides (strain ATCC BAA-1237 / DSM 17374 / SPN1) TaxID=760011 RepID=F4GH67_PARC1|nr:ABC transporter ATP-binding protein [Parasphaerochaeta coccoides]AEC01542.1 Polyamine-transporting ATPase [Parasphaerochaeta coccoides DSM 17374]
MSVKLVNITKVFTDHDNKLKEFTAVNNVNMEINEGEMVTLLGPSGCGKTTTLRIISGFENQTSGDVYIDDELVNTLPANKRNTSMVFQSYAIFPHLSVRQNIGFGLELKGFGKQRIADEVDKMMETMGLGPLGNRRPSQLSGGQQQRVALARAIVNKPRVLLFDEPLSNLDAKLREQMRIEIRRIQKQFNITSIYVTHDQIEAMTVSDRIVVMDKGVIQQMDTPFEIYSRPKNRFVADFIGRANFISAKALSVGETARISLNGRSYDFPSFNPDMKAGASCEIVIRPEGLVLGRTGDDAMLHGTITQAVYLGSTMEYEVAVEGMENPIQAISYNPVKEGFLQVGEQAAISFDVVSAHVISV